MQNPPKLVRRSQPNFKPSPCQSESNLVRQIFALMDHHSISAGSVSRLIGVHNVTLSNWRSGQNIPRLSDAERLAEALGMRLVLVKDPTNPVLDEYLKSYPDT